MKATKTCFRRSGLLPIRISVTLKDLPHLLCSGGSTGIVCRDRHLVVVDAGGFCRNVRRLLHAACFLLHVWILSGLPWLLNGGDEPSFRRFRD